MTTGPTDPVGGMQEYYDERVYPRKGFGRKFFTL